MHEKSFLFLLQLSLLMNNVQLFHMSRNKEEHCQILALIVQNQILHPLLGFINLRRHYNSLP